MSEQDKIQLFEDQKIRTAWDAEAEEWYFSVVDVVSVLTDQATPRGASTYWADLELVLTMLSEATTMEISKKEQPEGFAENLEVARSGGEIAGDTRKAIERRTGKPVVSTQNAAQLNGVVTELIEAIAAPEPEKPEDNQN